jgi:hypothetical protein
MEVLLLLLALWSWTGSDNGTFTPGESGEVSAADGGTGMPPPRP